MCLKVKEKKSYAFLDPLPNDTGHFVTVNVDDGVGNLNLSEVGREGTLGSS